jgi:hypothetical protein
VVSVPIVVHHNPNGHGGTENSTDRQTNGLISCSPFTLERKEDIIKHDNDSHLEITSVRAY